MSKVNRFIESTAGALFAVMLIYMLRAFLHLSEPFVWAAEIIICLILFFNYRRYYSVSIMDKLGYNLTVIFIVWLVLGFVRAAFYTDGYWMWKQIFSQLLISSFYIVILISANIEVVQKYYRLYWFFFLPLVTLSFFIEGTPLQLNYVPYSTLMLFFALITPRKRIYLVGIMTLYFTTNVQRNDSMKMIFCTLVGLTISYFYHRIPRWSIKFAHSFFIAIPFVLLLLAGSGTFNVFKMDEYIKGDFEQKVNSADGVIEDNLKADTRTFLYENVFFTVNKYGAWLLGRSPAFGDEGVNNFWGKDDATGLKGRFGNEVGILDVLLWYGLVGVFFYFLIYLRASYLAIYRSRNRYSKGVGLYVAFLWTWSFVWEKPLFETFFMMDLVMIGLCLSHKFRLMTDEEVKIWVKNIFKGARARKLIVNRYESPLDIKRTVS